MQWRSLDGVDGFPRLPASFRQLLQPCTSEQVKNSPDIDGILMRYQAAGVTDLVREDGSEGIVQL